MGNGVAEVDGLISHRAIKVHAELCSELGKLIVKVSRIFSKVEAVRPGCSSGIEALCLLNNGIVKAKSLLQQCSDSSVLYLALTGDAILSRCRRSKNLWEQSLSRIQSMVPLMLAAEISGIVADLKGATFCLDAREEEAGRVLHDLICRYGSSVDFLEAYALSAISTISTLLQLSTKKALLIEKRSIRKLLDKVDEGNKSKRNILLFFLNLLKAYERTITNEPRDSGSSDDAASSTFRSHIRSTRKTEIFDEFGRSFSSSQRYDDPVIMSSEQICEGMWIDKWLDKEDDICQETSTNKNSENLVLNYSAIDDISDTDPNMEVSSGKSMWAPISHTSSLGSSMNDFILPQDFSNNSMKSGQDPAKISNGVNSSQKLHEFISSFQSLSWESQCKAIKDAKLLLLENSIESCSGILLTNLVLLVIRFLKDAWMFLDDEASKTGCNLLLGIVQKYRREIPAYMTEDGYHLLASFLDTNISAQVLTIMEALSSQQECRYHIAKSGALFGISAILDGKVHVLLPPSLNTLINISSTIDISPYISIPELTFKLIHLLQDVTLSLPCVTILSNLSKTSDGRKSIAETEGCIASLASFLEQDDQELQEHSVSILVSLCSQGTEYCELVMEEGVIPGLVGISSTGNSRAMAMSLELLRILKNEYNATRERGGTDAIMESSKGSNVRTQWKTGSLWSKILCRPSVRGAKKKW